MRNLVAVIVLVGLLSWAAPVSAAWWNPLSWGKSAVVNTVDAAAETGRTGWSFSKELLVGTDEIVHWLWDTLHNKLLHPVVSVLTFGSINLDEVTELTEPDSE